MNKGFEIRFADRMNHLPPYLFGMIGENAGTEMM